MGKNQHVTPNGDKWKVIGEGNVKATYITNTQKKAIHKAIIISKNQGSELFIHGKDGRIRARNSYGNDPCPPKDNG